METHVLTAYRGLCGSSIGSTGGTPMVTGRRVLVGALELRSMANSLPLKLPRERSGRGSRTLSYDHPADLCSGFLGSRLAALDPEVVNGHGAVATTLDGVDGGADLHRVGRVADH